RGRYSGVVRARGVSGGAEEPVSLRKGVQDPGPGRSALGLLDPILFVTDLPLLARTTPLLTGWAPPSIPLAAVRRALSDRTLGTLTVTTVDAIVALAPI